MRDIEYLRYSLGAPVEYEYERNGYFYKEAGFEIPKEKITSEDVSLLAELSLSYYRRVLPSAESEKTVKD